jgi:hypothetical protein
LPKPGDELKTPVNGLGDEEALQAAAATPAAPGNGKPAPGRAAPARGPKPGRAPHGALEAEPHAM